MSAGIILWINEPCLGASTNGTPATAIRYSGSASAVFECTVCHRRWAGTPWTTPGGGADTARSTSNFLWLALKRGFRTQDPKT